MTDLQAPQSPAVVPQFVPEFCAPKNRPYLLAAAILASALGFIDGTVVSIALPAMRASLGANLVEAQWIYNAYVLTLSALILAGGAVGDRFGLARAFGAGVVVFVLSSLLCAMAPTPALMIVARAVQGIGAAVMVPGSLALIARAYPRAERGRAIGIWTAAASFTTALCPIIGGLALSFGGPEMWRAIFAINLPLGGVALWLLRTRVAQDPAGQAVPLDWPGALVATLALLALAWGLTQAGQGVAIWPWLAAGAALCGLFILVEARSPHPMMPLGMFALPGFAAANLMSFTLYGALGAMFFFMPMTFIAGWGESEIAASATFAPMSVFIGLFSARAGALADRIGPAPPIIVGCLLTGAGYGAMGLLAPAQNIWGHILPAMCLVGLGMALVVAPLSTAIMAAAPDRLSGMASGINNAVTRISGLFAVAAGGGIVAALYVRSGGMASFGEVSETTGHAAAMTDAFTGLAYLAAALCALSAVIAAVGMGRRV